LQPQPPDLLGRSGLRLAGSEGGSLKRRASNILNEYGAAQSELIGKAVVLTDGKAGTVESVWLDEAHGLRISIKGHDGRWPVSTIKFTEN
jgi:PRC-barrel domain